MIQRIQTLYLALASAALGLLVVLAPVLITLQSDTGFYELRAFNIQLLVDGVGTILMNAFPLAATLAFTIILCVYAIFQFNNRKFQMKVVRLAQLSHLLVVGMVVFYLDQMETLAGPGANGRSVSFWVAVPAVALVCTFLAFRAIKADDELVRSADRLR